MRHILFLLFMALTLQAIAQYPATGNKMRLGWQTTGDGLVYRGAIGDTATLDPSGLNNAWMLLDTANGNLYAYRAKAWRLVSGGGGPVTDTLTGEVKGPLDSTYIDTVANIIFTTTTDTTAGVGELKYNDTQGSLIQGLKGGNVTNVIGQQIHQRVLNATGAPLTKGTAVFLHGSQGNRITVRKALATADSTSANTFGIVAESIADNQSGYVITEGLITNMNTNALTEGAAVYLSPTIAGELTTTKPQAPQHTVYIGVCVKQNAGSGELFVKIRNGQELDELHDVRIDSLASNASLYYNAAQGVWRDTTGAVLTSDTSVFARDFQISGTANRLAMFTGANTVGNGPISRQSDTLNFVNDAGYAAFRMVNTSGGSSSSTFAGWPNGTRYIGRFGGSYEGFSFGDNSGAAQNSAAMQLTTWVGSNNRYYSTRFRVNSTGDFGLFLSPEATDANPTYSATPHLMILNGGNVGINTTTPAYRLDVNGDVNTTGMYKKSGTDIISGTTSYIPKFTGANTIGNSVLFDNGTSIGLGTTSPAGPGLTLGTTSSGRSLYMVSSSDGNNGLIQFKDQNGADALQIGGTSISNFLYGYGSRPLSFFTNVTERMRIDASGNVGIATASPSRPLHVNANTSMIIPSGATGTRPASGADGDLRYSTTFSNIEFYRTNRWMRPLVGTVANNKVAFASGDTLTSNTNFHWDNATTKLGIGNAAPDSTLTVTGGIRATRDMYARRYNVSTFTGQVVSINNYAPTGSSLGQNIFIGTTGLSNVYQGFILDGSFNTSVGVSALNANTTGYGNTALGRNTLSKNTKGSQNTAVGLSSLTENTLGDLNTGVGGSTLGSNTTGNSNTAVGASSLSKMISGSSNTGVGQSTITNNTTGSNNTAVGLNALDNLTTTSNNTAVGYLAGSYAGSGTTANQTSSNSTYVGYQARAGASGNTAEVVIGSDAVGNGSNTVTIGGSTTTGIYFQYGETYIGTAVDSGAYTLQVNGNTKLMGNLARKKPVTIAAATYTVLSDDSWLICNHTAQITITLPTAANSIGRELMIKYVAGGGATVISNATNVSPIVGGALTNIILPATAGSWVTLVCDGANWIIMQKG